MVKGRSSSRQLNYVLKKLSSVCLAACFVPALVYVSTHTNPADRPSRWYHDKRIQVLNVADKQTRAKQRALVGKLRDHRIQTSTLKRYNAALLLFLTWLAP
eukprot:2436550-Karenia_brevis.AAC.1